MDGIDSRVIRLACSAPLKRQCNAFHGQRARIVLCTRTWHAYQSRWSWEERRARWDSSPPLIAVLGEQLTCSMGTSGECSCEKQYEVTQSRHGAQGLEALERQGGGAARCIGRVGLLLASMTHRTTEGRTVSSAGLC